MSAKSITGLNLNSLTISNSNYGNIKGFTAQSNTLETNNTGTLLVNGIPISSGGGGVDDITAGDGISVNEVSTGVFEITNDGVLALTQGTNITITGTKSNLTINSTGGGGGNVDAVTAGTGISVTENPSGSGIFEIENVGVLSLIQGDGISLDFTTGDITVTSTVNPADYYTVTDADNTFQTKTAMGDYSTTAQADDLYQTLAGMNSYSTTTEANALYQTLTGMNSYSTTTQANALYQSQVAMANYSTTAQANVLYAPLFTPTTLTVATSAIIPTTSTTELFLNPSIIPNGGTFLYSIHCYVNSYDADGTKGAYVESALINLYTRNALNESVTVGSQFFTSGSTPVDHLPITLSGIVNLVDDMAIYFTVGPVVLASGGTQYNVQNAYANSLSQFIFTRIG